jgi:hypothetical protein
LFLLLLYRGENQSADSGMALAVFCKGHAACALVQAPPSNIKCFYPFTERSDTASRYRANH